MKKTIEIDVAVVDLVLVYSEPLDLMKNKELIISMLLLLFSFIVNL